MVMGCPSAGALDAGDVEAVAGMAGILGGDPVTLSEAKGP
jgi:hypothetical protein